MNIVFFGTSEFSVAILEKLVSDFFYPVLVVAQPDRPTGRKQVLTAPPIKHVCLTHRLPLLQPERVIDALAEIAAAKPDLIITASYGQIIPAAVLDLAKHGAINVHTSLLPKYRGASPIQAAILNGDTHTGITIMNMDAGMDHGPIILQKGLEIGADETAVSLHARLATLGADTLTKVLPDYLAGRMKPVAQDHAAATFCKIIKKEDARVDWQKSAVEVSRLVRAYFDWPCAWTMLPKGKRLKIVKARPVDAPKIGLQPGELFIDNERAFIGCTDGALELLDVQVEGKEHANVTDFARGYHALSGQRCPSPSLPNTA
ncbi:MAG: methionyl-tRNA formyltransferase [Parcubacteria group bacterium]|nr:methionyl-tRNA formyltransferase [Parcubacteria group bacterium]